MIHIELHPALATRYAELAREQGLPVEQYIAERLQNFEPNAQPPLAEPAMTPEERAVDIDEWLKRLRKHTRDIPTLPEEAFTRASFYQE